jgi:hypothetical protein
LRHAFRTAADAAKDKTAINYVMGHSDGTMGENYTHGIDDGRSRAVGQCVPQRLRPGIDFPVPACTPRVSNDEISLSFRYQQPGERKPPANSLIAGPVR